MSMTSASEQYFEKVADSWDSLRSGYFQEEVRQCAIAKAWLRPDMTAADIGSGTGFMAAGIAPYVQNMVVMDGSAAMLDVACKNLAGFDNIRYIRSDGQALDLPDETMDAVFANMYLHHCPDPLAAIKEMVRILKPGGRLIITDMDRHEYTWLKEEMADEWLGFEREQMRRWYEAAGLVNVFVDCTGQSCCAESGNDALQNKEQREANISVFVAVGTKRLSMRQAVQDEYGSIARQGVSCCGSAQSNPLAPAQTSCCDAATAMDSGFVVDYTPADKAGVPAEAEQISLGCGNPGAIARMQPGETVLDIGSGGGMDAFLSAKQVGAKGKVIGVDMTPDMLERARATAAKAGIANVEFREGVAEVLPVNDQTIDVVISNCVINLCEDKGKIFMEAYRVLKPGGRLEVSDMVSDKAFPLQSSLDAKAWSACISGALPESEYLDLIRQAGFSEPVVKRSAASSSLNGVSAYSVHVSARKADGQETCSCSTGNSSGCC